MFMDGLNFPEWKVEPVFLFVAERERSENTMAEKKPKIESGYRIGHLTVTEATSQRKNGYTVWKCVCDCGNEILLDTRYLQRGTMQDCGCISKRTTHQQCKDGLLHPGQKDLTGQRFGKLVCVSPTAQRGKSGGTVWLCRCDCGNECLAVSTQLTQGYKKSCGCRGYPPIDDLTGKVFGKLTVIEQTGWKNGTCYCRCHCECGNETTVRYAYLITGHTKSCGCLQKEAYKNNLKLVDGTSVSLLEANRRRTISTNTSGYTGVYHHSKSGKWVAQITFKGKTYYLGAFDKLEDAVKARKCSEEMYDKFLEWYYSEHPASKAPEKE